MHFFVPLLLMSKKSPDIHKLLIFFLDGIPLALGSMLLPKVTFLNPSVLAHVHVHAFMEQQFAAKNTSSHKNTFSKDAFIALYTIWNTTFVAWSSSVGIVSGVLIRTHTRMGAEGFAQKKKIVSTLIDSMKVSSALDIGANTGMFTKTLYRNGIVPSQ